MTEKYLIRKIKNKLKKENLFVRTLKDVYGNKVYTVVDSNNVIQTGNQGLCLDELIRYAE